MGKECPWASCFLFLPYCSLNSKSVVPFSEVEERAEHGRRLRKMSLELRREARAEYSTCTAKVVETPSPAKISSKPKASTPDPVPPAVAAHVGCVCFLVDDRVLSPKSSFLVSSVCLPHGIILRPSECLAWCQDYDGHYLLGLSILFSLSLQE